MDSPYDLLWAGIGNPDEQCKASAVEHPGDVRLRRPERSVDIRTVQTRQGSNTQETCCPLDDPFILVTYPHFICIANSFSTEKEDTHTGYPQKASTRRDSNSPNVGKATKIKEERTLSKVCLQAVYNLENKI